MSRKLASLRIVNGIFPIEGADQIELVQVDSWKVVVKKGNVKIGDIVVYFEIDSWMPKTIAPFLIKNTVKTYNGVEGERLRTIKLKGQLSQGLIMTIQEISEVFKDFQSKVGSLVDGSLVEGTDVTELLGIMKWESPENVTNIANSKPKGNFPEFIPKTDQERIQNLTKNFEEFKKDSWEVTEKYDGSSMTVYKHGVCSRNLDLYRDAENQINSYWEIAINEKLLDKLEESGLNIALQGELVGNKINNNIYKLTNRDFWLFDIYDIDNSRYYTPEERRAFCLKYNIKHVPVLYTDYKIPDTFTIQDLLKFAEGKSVMNKQTEREGLVFKRNGSGNNEINSFKVISNKYLLKN